MRMRREILRLVENERRNEPIQRDLVKTTLAMLVELGVNTMRVYEEEFQVGFLAATANHYRVESNQYVSANSCPDYCRRVRHTAATPPSSLLLLHLLLLLLLLLLLALSFD